LDSMGVMGLPITPGSDSQVSWRNATGNAYSEMNFDTSKGSSVNGEVRWGLVELRKIQEPLNEVEILARISPKEVKKEAEIIFKSLGLNMSVAMNLFLKKCINENGIPFDLKVPNKETIEAMEETNKILNGDIERKSYKNADELFEDLGV